MVPFSIGTRHTAPSKEHTGRHVAVQKKSLSCLLLLGLGVIPLRGFDQQGLGHASLCSANIPPMATGFNIRPMATVAANIRPMTTVAGCDFGSHRRCCSLKRCIFIPVCKVAGRTCLDGPDLCTKALLCEGWCPQHSQRIRRACASAQSLPTPASSSQRHHPTGKICKARNPTGFFSSSARMISRSLVGHAGFILSLNLRSLWMLQSPGMVLNLGSP